MRRLFKALGLLIVLALAAGAVWAGLNRDRVARLAATMSLFDEGEITSNFSHMETAFLTTPMARGDGPVSPLPAGPAMTLPDGAADWIAARSVTALVVLDDGELVHESYHAGTDAQDRRISWSVAKSFLSALTGIVLAEGAIDSLDDPVTRYAPALQGSAYDGATLRNVLQMSSGVSFDEDYLDFWSDINKMGRTLAIGGSMDDFAAGQRDTWTAPGTQWRYVSIDTHVIGMVLRGATGRTIPDLMEEKLIRPLGLERDPLYITDGDGVAFVLGGLNLTTRDYARFAQMIAQQGQWQGRQVVPADWIAESTAASAPTEAGAIGYGYQWWVPADARPGEFFARGIYGQYLYIDTARGVVIASNAADRGFREDGVTAQNIAMLRRLAEAAEQ